MRKFGFTLFALVCSLLLVAQEESLQADAAIDDINAKWYASPWVWVAGAALIIVLLVLLSRGKDNKT